MKIFWQKNDFIHWQPLFITTLQHYTYLTQCNNILNNSIKHITPINILINLSSLLHNQIFHDQHLAFLNNKSWTITTDFWISNSIKKTRVLSFWIGEELCHQFMKEILEILNSRWQIITLGFQIYLFGEERAVYEKETLEKKICCAFCNFLKIHQFGPW